MDHQKRAILVVGFGEVSLVVAPGGAALVAEAGVRVIRAVEASAGRRQIGAVTLGDPVLLDVELVYPGLTQDLHRR